MIKPEITTEVEYFFERMRVELEAAGIGSWLFKSKQINKK